ncbi:ergothioneine biosynthesis protein EgtB [Pontibacter sp. JH31]|uniref:Ergothioneine biosynthesis protein EgtB n=1 Tax=Pontibacter aquaedesilientis TaxID=2766980 RepID=A0ABR7XDD4_9BACT|nr:ergothioneine biosynthesis protein EgtB [Pontibacter aquaedesilientis]MBD1396308.1 ergothioneine biosynthesis protein EgtB [Pontibacter aquaedesilientis]
MQTLTDSTTQQLLKRFEQIRTQTETICAPLEPEDTVVQPMVDVSPPKWHMAHTTWFFEQFVLLPHLKGYKVFHPSYSFLFNSYYNSVGNRVQRAERSTLTRPPLRDVYTYRKHVNEHLKQLLQTANEATIVELMPVLELGLQHEQQHQELLITDIKYILSTNPLLPAYQKQQGTADNITAIPEATFLDIPGGVYTIGYQGNDFCFDNELGVHDVLLSDFQVMNRLVTNGEYLNFVQDGGYRDFRFWLDEGLALVRSTELKSPLYWMEQDGEWLHYTMQGLKKIDLNQPVTHISFYEAQAYANWAGKRLLTEFEWEAASQVYPPSNGNFQESGRLEPDAADSSTGMQQLYGDTWEWTYSAYHPYPGFSTAPGALGEYNGKFMINQMVLRGGSCATPQSHIRTTYRNFFHPDKRWQYTGIRLAQ